MKFYLSIPFRTKFTKILKKYSISVTNALPVTYLKYKGLGLMLLFITGLPGMNNVFSQKQEQIGFDAMANPETLPFLYPDGVQTKQFITYDASGDNEDFSFNENWVKYVDKNGEYVIFDAMGPGCLYRQQMNAWGYIEVNGMNISINNKLGTSRSDASIKYYFDYETEPTIDAHFDDFFTGKVPPYDSTFVYFDKQNRFSISYYPMIFKKHLKITVVPDNLDFINATHTNNYHQGSLKWFQYTYLTYPAEYNLKNHTQIEKHKKTIINSWKNLGNDPKNTIADKSIMKEYKIPKGESVTILDYKGQGSVSSFKLNLKPYNQETFSKLNLKIYWDGNKTAAVDLPLCYFFGGGGVAYPEIDSIIWKKHLTTLFYGFDGNIGSFYSYWPMPFWESARVVVTNNSREDPVKLESEILITTKDVYDYPKNECAYFHVKQTNDHDNGNEYYSTSFEEIGRGHVVGLMFYSDKYNMDGDENTYIDDSQTPQMHGDGTEDDHNQAWGGGPAIQPLWGGLVNGFQGSYRIYLNDSYVFNKNIRIVHEYSRCCARDLNIPGGKTDMTVFYYKSPFGSNLELSDELDVGNSSAEERHDYIFENQTFFKRITQGYDGYEKNYDHGVCNDEGRSNKGFSEFTVKIDPKNNGVKIRKRINRFNNGIQTAEVFVDGERCKSLWHIVTNSQSPKSSHSPHFDGWYDSDYEVHSSYTRGKNKLRIKIKYVDYAKLGNDLNEFYYWIYTYHLDHLAPAWR